MAGSDALYTMAELGVAFAGFASVVTVFRRRDDGEWSSADVIRFRLMISASLCVALFAMLPSTFVFFGASSATTWATCSAVFAVAVSTISAVALRASIRVVAPGGINPVVMWATVAIGLGAILLQVLNASGLFFQREVGPYYAGLLCLLTISAVSFARLLPVGRPSGE